MDFARRQLLKYGWTEGKGLGKDESGIPEALKPQLKFDTAGVGHDRSEQFTFNWWENVYNNAADNINVVKKDGSVNVKLNTDDSVDITTKKYYIKNMKKKSRQLEYGSFLKTSKLTADGVVEHEDKIDPSAQVLKLSNLTDEELFRACGGRTAHKGARHGLKLNGKLARIEKQEFLLLQQMKMQANKLGKETGKLETEIRVKVEKRKKHKKKKVSSENDCTNNNLSSSEDNMKKKSKKRKYALSDTESMDVEAAQKRREYHQDKQKRKKIKIKKRLLDKKLSKMTDMLENVCVSNILHDNKDDGFVESSKKADADVDEDDKVVKKKSKKKRKLNIEVCRGSEDDGFEEYISEVNEKLMHYKELRKDLQNEKRLGDEKRMDKMAEDFEKCCDL